jgi:glycine cleavage system transcriptional repressor
MVNLIETFRGPFRAKAPIFLPEAQPPMTPSSQSFVISIMSRDRVGIVYEVSSALAGLQGNIADIRQSVLCGYFTMIFLVSFPPEVTRRAIERRLAQVDSGSETAISFMVEEMAPGIPAGSTPIPPDAYVLTAAGADQVGIVANVSAFCVKHAINILDLSTTSAAGEYAMVLIVDLSRCVSVQGVRQDLQEFSRGAGLRVVLQHYDIFRAVNEINLPRR